MKNFKSFVAQIQEEKSKSVVFAFGRFNPVTIGHQKLFEKVASIGYFKRPSCCLCVTFARQ